MTDPAADAGQWVRTFDELVGFMNTILTDQGHIALGIHPDGTGRAAWSGFAFVNGQGMGHGDGKQGFVPILKFHGAGLKALPAVHAAVGQNPSGFLDQCHPGPFTGIFDFRDPGFRGLFYQGVVSDLIEEETVPSFGFLAPTFGRAV
jgi:hypothetical protein